MGVDLRVVDKLESDLLTFRENKKYTCAREDIKSVHFTVSGLYRIMQDILLFDVDGVACQRFDVESVLNAIRAVKHMYTDKDSYEYRKLSEIRSMCVLAKASGETELYYA